MVGVRPVGCSEPRSAGWPVLGEPHAGGEISATPTVSDCSASVCLGNPVVSSAQLFESEAFLRYAVSGLPEIKEPASELEGEQAGEPGEEVGRRRRFKWSATSVREQPEVDAAVWPDGALTDRSAVAVDAEKDCRACRIQIADVDGAGGLRSGDDFVEVAGALAERRPSPRPVRPRSPGQVRRCSGG